MLLQDRLLIIVIGFAVIGIVASIPFSRTGYRVISVIISIAVVITAGVALRDFESGTTVSEGSTVQAVIFVNAGGGSENSVKSQTVDSGEYLTIQTADTGRNSVRRMQSVAYF